ncbi:glycosyltransferase [Tessaracoccus aquimaris]|uniref:CDP-glycerol glycerophosphotransferase family protein n=1 Tax=Tessaracoccus aquimaris TaxID=1332264 RepID=UPI001F007971
MDPGKKLVLYAPTWRGESVSQVTGDGAALLDIQQRLISLIDPDQYQVLIKPHPYTYRALSPEERESGRFIPQQVDANELFSLVDILISDYSSIYLDFLITGRPVLFYLPDQETYLADRGVYFDLDELPGPVTHRLEKLAQWIKDIDSVADSYAHRYRETRQWACARDDGKASERVARAVFGGVSDGVVDDFLTRAPIRLLFYVSSFGANGVSSAFRALLSMLDRTKYDITVYGLLSDEVGRRNFDELQDVRSMPRFGAFTMTAREAKAVEYYSRYAADGPLFKLFNAEEPLRRDYRRSFGDAAFDYVIDFSGYGTLFPGTFRYGAGEAKRIIWQHNDLAADIQNRGKRKLKKYSVVNTSLTGLRDTYGAFDKVVSCGEHVMEVNREKLSTPSTYDKFTFVNNVIEVERVRALLEEEPEYKVDGHLVAAVAGPAGARRLTLVPNTPPAPESGLPFITFVTLGRLSPEKNQANLIKAFGLFLQEYPNARLYILGGGDLDRSLKGLASSLGIAELVSLPGHLRNPFMLAKHCDCFLLPSRYEGFGLVVPEMRMLRKPIILSRFDAAPSVSIPGGQYEIGFEVEDILGGLRAYAKGDVPGDYEFDVDGYNEAAYQQFEQMLESLDGSS